MQNLFHQGKGNRSISLNSHYLVLFKNPRDKLQSLTLAKQMPYPGRTDFFLKQYEEAVLRRPYGYLLIDLKTTTQDDCRLRTKVLPGRKYPSGVTKISETAKSFIRPSSTSHAAITKRMALSLVETSEKTRKLNSFFSCKTEIFQVSCEFKLTEGMTLSL